jgi:hypothetical protein
MAKLILIFALIVIPAAVSKADSVVFVKEDRKSVV